MRDIAKGTNNSMIGILEYKLDSTVLDLEMYIKNYKTFLFDRNWYGGTVVCYIRKDISYKLKSFLFQMKLKIPYLIFYNWNYLLSINFFDVFWKDLSKFYTSYRDIFFLGDFNLFKSRKYVFDKFCSNKKNLNVHPW